MRRNRQEPVAELVRGSAVAVHGAETVQLSSNIVVGKGDRIVTAAGSNARIKLATGTTVLVEEEGDVAIVEPTVAAVFPEGWAADAEAFKSGLDFSSREMLPQDLTRLTEWYERTIGYVPKSIQFGLKHNPQFVKVNRAK